MQLSGSFFDRPTLRVAKDLIGKVIVRTVDVHGKKIKLKARIVETEAYLGKDDPASHSSRGKTKRNEVMFREPGLIYVYFIYGNYEMLNFVTEKNGTAGAVLIRAIEPIEGEEVMKKFRFNMRSKIHKKALKKTELTSGPAKLTMALNINRKLNGIKLGTKELVVFDAPKVKNIVQTTRIGISQGSDLPFRFYEKNNPYVSVL